MGWNWQRKDWPNFSYQAGPLVEFEKAFLISAGKVIAVFNFLSQEEQENVRIQLIQDEAFKTSEIEGEILDRDSLQSSIRKAFGLSVANLKANPSEEGISEMLVDLYLNFKLDLSSELLLKWHRTLMKGRSGLKDLGKYRTHSEPMQVVSGSFDNPKVHFEAPPSRQVPQEMKQFIAWYNGSLDKTPALTRAGIAHLYFVSIHPFEDGNGRIGRALSEKSLSQSLKKANLIALSFAIEEKRKDYYQMLEQSNKDNEIGPWLEYFAKTILEAQEHTYKKINFLVKKTKFYDTFRTKLNPRQMKVVNRVFKEGLNGFQGGLSAKNYISIARTSQSSATRDLKELVNLGAFKKTGQLKGTRYWLQLDLAKGLMLNKKSKKE